MVQILTRVVSKKSVGVNDMVRAEVIKTLGSTASARGELNGQFCGLRPRAFAQICVDIT